jgi:hypothetical protein
LDSANNAIKPEAQSPIHWTKVPIDTFALVGAMITYREKNNVNVIAEWNCEIS